MHNDPTQKSQWSHRLTALDPEMRAEALAALRVQPHLFGELFHLVVDDPHPKVRVTLLHGVLLAEAHLPRELLERLLTTELSSHVDSRRYRALGLLHFLQTVDVGSFLSRAAKDTRLEARVSILQTMRTRLPELSDQHIDKILRAQLQSPVWQHRLLGLACLKSEPRLPRGKFLVMCAGERQAQVHRLLLDLARESAASLSEGQAEELFKPEVVAHEWKKRLAAVMLLRKMPQKSAAALIQLTAEDPILAVRSVAQASVVASR